MARSLFFILFLFSLSIAGCATPTSQTGFHEVDLRELPCHWFKNDPNDKYFPGLQRARTFADWVAIYSIAANKAYSKDPLIVEDIPFPKNENWVEIKSDKATDDNIGFAARAWRRTTFDGRSELIISYRGTNFSDWRDWLKGNLVFAKYLFGRTQFDAALDFALETVRKNDDDKIDEIILVGHSLGGGLAEYVQRLLPESKAITFDTSPNQGRLYSAFSKKYPKDSIRMYEKGEVLSYIRYILSPDLTFDERPDGKGTKAIWMDFYSDGPIEGHTMRDLSVSLVKLAASVGNESAIDVLKQLEARPRKYQLDELICPGNTVRMSIRTSRDKEQNKLIKPTASESTE